MGFFEILLVAVVALLVVGPQRMPEAVRTVALTIGRFKRSFNAIRDDLEKQVGADEIRSQLHKETILQNLNSLQDEVDEVNRAFDATDAVNEASTNTSNAKLKSSSSGH